MKIAPQVQRLVASKMMDAPTTSELRALIAVAKLAKQMHRRGFTTGSGNLWIRQGRALARLERVSGGGR